MSGIQKLNGFVKTGIIAATLFAGYNTLRASNPIKDAKPNETEVVSKSGAEALKAMSMPEVGLVSTPTTHNPRLDNTFRKFATNEEETQQVNSLLNSMYNAKGTFLASAQIQHELDRQQLLLLLEEKGDLLTKNGLNPKLGKEIEKFGSDFYKSVRPNASKLTRWLDNDYTPKLLGSLYFDDDKPSATQLIEKIDYIAENKANFSTNDIIKYHTSTDYFDNTVLNNKTDPLSLSESIAFRIFTIDLMLFERVLRDNDAFGENSHYNEYTGFSRYYEDWMKTVKPIGN